MVIWTEILIALDEERSIKGCHIFSMHDPSFLGLEERYHNKTL